MNLNYDSRRTDRRRGYRTSPLNVGLLKDLNDKGTTIILTTHYLEKQKCCAAISALFNTVSWWKILDEGAAGEAEIRNLYSRSRTKSPLPKLDGYQYRLVDTATWKLKCCVSRGSTAYLRS